eukprot:768595-Hanusia_phi.AAC.6
MQERCAAKVEQGYGGNREWCVGIQKYFKRLVGSVNFGSDQARQEAEVLAKKMHDIGRNRDTTSIEAQAEIHLQPHIAVKEVTRYSGQEAEFNTLKSFKYQEQENHGTSQPEQAKVNACAYSTLSTKLTFSVPGIVECRRDRHGLSCSAQPWA